MPRPSDTYRAARRIAWRKDLSNLPRAQRKLALQSRKGHQYPLKQVGLMKRHVTNPHD